MQPSVDERRESKATSTSDVDVIPLRLGPAIGDVRRQVAIASKEVSQVKPATSAAAAAAAVNPPMASAKHLIRESVAKVAMMQLAEEKNQQLTLNDKIHGMMPEMMEEGVAEDCNPFAHKKCSNL